MEDLRRPSDSSDEATRRKAYELLGKSKSNNNAMYSSESNGSNSSSNMPYMTRPSSTSTYDEANSSSQRDGDTLNRKFNILEKDSPSKFGKTQEKISSGKLESGGSSLLSLDRVIDEARKRAEDENRPFDEAEFIMNLVQERRKQAQRSASSSGSSTEKTLPTYRPSTVAGNESVIEPSSSAYISKYDQRGPSSVPSYSNLSQPYLTPPPPRDSIGSNPNSLSSPQSLPVSSVYPSASSGLRPSETPKDKKYYDTHINRSQSSYSSDDDSDHNESPMENYRNKSKALLSSSTQDGLIITSTREADKSSGFGITYSTAPDNSIDAIKARASAVLNRVSATDKDTYSSQSVDNVVMSSSLNKSYSTSTHSEGSDLATLASRLARSAEITPKPQADVSSRTTLKNETISASLGSRSSSGSASGYAETNPILERKGPPSSKVEDALKTKDKGQDKAMMDMVRAKRREYEATLRVGQPPPPPPPSQPESSQMKIGKSRAVPSEDRAKALLHTLQQKDQPAPPPPERTSTSSGPHSQSVKRDQEDINDKYTWEKSAAMERARDLIAKWNNKDPQEIANEAVLDDARAVISRDGPLMEKPAEQPLYSRTYHMVVLDGAKAALEKPAADTETLTQSQSLRQKLNTLRSKDKSPAVDSLPEAHSQISNHPSPAPTKASNTAVDSNSKSKVLMDLVRSKRKEYDASKPVRTPDPVTVIRSSNKYEKVENEVDHDVDAEKETTRARRAKEKAEARKEKAKQKERERELEAQKEKVREKEDERQGDDNSADATASELSMISKKTISKRANKVELKATKEAESSSGESEDATSAAAASELSMISKKTISKRANKVELKATKEAESSSGESEDEDDGDNDNDTEKGKDKKNSKKENKAAAAQGTLTNEERLQAYAMRQQTRRTLLQAQLSTIGCTDQTVAGCSNMQQNINQYAINQIKGSSLFACAPNPIAQHVITTNVEFVPKASKSKTAAADDEDSDESDDNNDSSDEDDGSSEEEEESDEEEEEEEEEIKKTKNNSSKSNSDADKKTKIFPNTTKRIVSSHPSGQKIVALNNPPSNQSNWGGLLSCVQPQGPTTQLPKKKIKLFKPKPVEEDEESEEDEDEEGESDDNDGDDDSDESDESDESEEEPPVKMKDKTVHGKAAIATKAKLPVKSPKRGT